MTTEDTFNEVGSVVTALSFGLWRYKLYSLIIDSLIDLFIVGKLSSIPWPTLRNTSSRVVMPIP